MTAAHVHIILASVKSLNTNNMQLYRRNLKLYTENQFKLSICQFICITLRQCAILCSILIFFITSFITAALALASVHDRHIQQLLEDDIHNENAKHHQDNDGGQTHRNSNEMKLRYSLHYIMKISNLFAFCTWLSMLNLILAALLVYGIGTRTPMNIMPWVVVSGLTYTMTLIALVVAQCQFAFHVSYGALLIFTASSAIFLTMWYTIVRYSICVLNAARTCRSTGDSLLLKSYDGNDGYMHTVQTATKGNEKVTV